MLKHNKEIRVQNVRKDDFIVNARIESNQIKYRVEDAQTQLTAYLAAGYTVYDVVASGGFNALSSLSAGKYICLWVNGTPTGTYTSYNAAYTTHTNVVIMGIRVDSSYKVVSVGDAFTLTGNEVTIDGKNKLKLLFCNITISKALNGCAGASFSNLTLPGPMDINEFSIMEYNTFVVTGTGRLTHTGTAATNVTMQNCVIRAPIVASYTNTKLILQNCLIDASIEIGSSTNPSYLDVEFQNVYLNSGYTLTFYATANTANNIIYNNSGTLAGRTAYLKNVVVNSIEAWAELDYYSLTSSYLTSTSGYSYLPCIPVFTRKLIRGFLGTIKRNYYTLQFDQSAIIPDSLKYNDDTDLLIWYRDNIETSLTALSIAKIKNLLFYQTNGTTQVTTFRDSESFLILAERDAASGTYAVFAWHKGALAKTIYSEVWDNETYTIVRAFNVLEFPDELSYGNLYNITDSPIDASWTMQDITSKVVRL